MAGFWAVNEGLGCRNDGIHIWHSRSQAHSSPSPEEKRKRKQAEYISYTWVGKSDILVLMFCSKCVEWLAKVRIHTYWIVKGTSLWRKKLEKVMDFFLSFFFWDIIIGFFFPQYFQVAPVSL